MKNIHHNEHGGYEMVLVQPHVTEKSARASEGGEYVFLIAKSATKRDVSKAMKVVYGVDPVSVNIVRVKGKVRTVRGKLGRKPGTKKAYVTLAKGTKIELA